ncbi:MAG: 50S ribosomal protein L10 [Planctomycetes bacterium]|nr:50S ribosomal protein L10 [Planctomycetota bacterium]
MSTYVKGLFQKELEKKFEAVDDFLVVDTKGVGGNDNNEMRGALKAKGIRLAVVKNAMMSRALEGLGKPSAKSLFEVGPKAVAYGGDSIVDVAKEIAEWGKKLEVVSIEGAFVDGEVLDTDSAMALSKMPNRIELQGAVVMLANSPGRRIAGGLIGPGGIIAGCIKGLVEKLEKEAA